MLIDTHCHVQMRQFAADRERVIASAFSGGIGRLIVPGTDVETSKAALDLAEQYAGRIFAGVGVHPHDASTLTPQALIELRRAGATAQCRRHWRDRPGLLPRPLAA